MMILAVWIKHPRDVPVQGAHDADAREHRPVRLSSRLGEKKKVVRSTGRFLLKTSVRCPTNR